MRYLLSLFLIMTSFVVSAQDSGVAYEVSLGVDFESYFDNREYAKTSGESGSDLAARLMPTLSWQFSRSESLTVGVDWVVPFGSVGSSTEDGVKSESYYYDIKSLIYYTLNAGRWRVVTGMFSMAQMSMESYGEAFFSSEYRFYSRVMSGLLGAYRNGESFFEMACDWMGQPSTSTRERFVVYSAGCHQFGDFVLGYNLSMMHFAGQKVSGLDNVVDNGLVAPYIGYGHRFDGGLLFDLRVGYLQSLQQDRRYEDGWQTPAMWEFGFGVSRWGFTIENQLYLGDNLQPLYDGHTLDDGTVVTYGDMLYFGAQDFRTDGGYYNRSALSYDRVFGGGRVRLRGQLVFHTNAEGVANQQILELSVKLGKIVYKGK
ncbi:MAG: hypothetical protein SNH63_04660 [Rikenellaceae bacterium]